MIPSFVTDAISSFLSHPVTQVGAAMIVALPVSYLATAGKSIGSHLIRRNTDVLKNKTEELVRDCEGLTLKEASRKLKTYIEQNWVALSGGEECLNQPQNGKALYDKLYKIILGKQPLQVKSTICQNIVRNFKESNLRTISRVRNDLINDTEFKTLFGIKEGSSITHVQRLGEETHHKGEVPCLIQFSDGTKIVYKPRSMHSEKIICGHEKSYFAKLKEQHGRELGTYRIIDKKDYGYSEFLNNREEENTYENITELSDYARKLVVLDQFSKPIHLTDVHNGNIAVDHKMPYAIDTEVVLEPDKKGIPFDTMILRWGNAIPSWHIEEGTINRVFWKETGRITDFGDASTDGERLFREYIDEEEQKCPPITEEEQKLVEECREKLMAHKHRIVMIDTQTLDGFIKKPLTEETRTKFLEFLSFRLDLHGFELDSSQEKAIWEKFQEDILNNDVPVFYFDPQTNSVFYDDLKISGYHGA